MLLQRLEKRNSQWLHDMEDPNENYFEFLLFYVSKALLERESNYPDYSQLNIDAKFNNTNIDENKTFRTNFLINIIGSEASKSISIQVEAGAAFKIHGNPSDEEITTFMRINSPAIVYPYVRAFIANFTLTAGINPINLPVLNFVNQIEKKLK